MDLTRIELLSSAAEADLLTAFLATELNHGWEEQTQADGNVLCIVHTENEDFAQEFLSIAAQKMPQVEISTSRVQQTNWVEAWKEFFTPVYCGRFTVLAPWMEEEKKQALAQGQHPIIIEPKTAFGTGHHASTALCLGGLSKLLEQGRVKAGQRFLDLGTGSGILAIGAAKSGLSGLALDIDMLAVENALENSPLNAVTDKISVRRGSLGAPSPDNASAQEVTELFDLIFANILAEPLKTLAPYIAARLKPTGALLLSGILGKQAQDVAAVYVANGLPQPEFTNEGEWSLLTFYRS